MAYRGASEAARWQAYQTRARMGVKLWFQVFLLVLLGWFILTIYAVWHETGEYFPQLSHAYFGRWVLCALLIKAPLIGDTMRCLPMPLNGARYLIGPLADWLNGPQMYNAPFTAWFSHYGWRTALIPIAVAGGVLFWRARHLVDSEHIRGLRLMSPKQHHKQLNGGRVMQLIARHGVAGMSVGTSVIPTNRECEHFLVTGSPGSGKSTLIRHMLAQIQERGQRAIVLDPDAEFVQEFYDEGRGDVVLNPLDARCPFWSPWLEFRDNSFAMDSEAMAASLIRGQAKTPTEEFFRQSSRTLIEAIFQVVKDRNNSDGITDFLALPREEIQQALKGTQAYPLIDPGAHEQGSGILATAANAVKPFHHLPKREQASRVWSARQWAQSREGWVFLPSTEDARAAIQRLQGVWLDSLVRWLMSCDIGSDQVWVMADELPAMEYQPQIEQLVVRGRKRGLAVVMGFQNVSQLRSIYGRDGAVTLTSSPTTKVILRCDEAETAKWASELLGSREIERMNMTQLAGLSSMREGVNLQPQRTTEHIVTPAEVQLLKPFQGYLCIAGFDRTTITIPEQHLDKRYPAFLPRNAQPAVMPRGLEAPVAERYQEF
jgi:type IV secretory pathway TraG/TraD family ATPase VirD4